MKTIIATSLLIGWVFTQDNIREKHFNIEDNLAIQGYDPVAYFTDSEAIKGEKDIYLNHEGVNYRFETLENLTEFKSNPEKYEPAYGGWCAYAMGVSGDKVKIDPETFKIVDGKLNLFYNFYFNNTLKDWNKNEQELKIKANQNWAKIYK